MFEVKDDHIHCIQAEEERYEQELNRKRKSKAGKKGAKARWNSE
jgi:uncharacterized small protein (DUF1192 family)|tara:strand:+ start:371 stop:502 length:132 start_codon:yes stop_codon:yes gene_type:complete